LSQRLCVHRLLKAHDLISSPAFIVIKAAEAFKDKTTAPNQLWQTDFTYLKVIGCCNRSFNALDATHRVLTENGARGRWLRSGYSNRKPVDGENWLLPVDARL
jgi:hypothetical protein